MMISNIKGNVFVLFIWLLCLTAIRSQGFQFKELQVTALSYKINTTTTYSILYDRKETNSFSSTNWQLNPVQPNTTVTLTFPIQYTLDSSIVVKYQINSAGNFFTAIISRNNNKITFSQVFAPNTLLSSLVVLVQNVVNPLTSGTTNDFQGTIGDDVADSIGVNSVAHITAGTSICSFTFNPNSVYLPSSSMIFTVTLSNQLPSDGSIRINYPLSRLWSQDLNTTRLMPIGTSMSCSPHSSNLNSAIQCSGNSGTATVTVTNLLTSSLNSGTTFSFSVNNFNMPPTNQAVDAITVTTYKDVYAIDQCKAFVNGLVPRVIPSTQFLITQTDNKPMIVNRQYTLKFEITTVMAISRTQDIFFITLPPETTIFNFASAIIGGTVGFNIARSTFFNNLLTLYMTGAGNINPGRMFITITNFVAPPSTLRTGNFILNITNSNSFPKMISENQIVASPGSINGTTSVAVSTVNAVTSYTFSISLGDPITSDGKIKIVFPSSVGVSGTISCTVLSGTDLRSSPTCAYNSIQHSISLNSLNTSSNNIPAQTFTLRIAGIINPPTTANTSTFTLTSYFTNNQSTLVGSGVSTGIRATPGTIDPSQCSISADSLLTSAVGVTYSLSCVLSHGVSTGGYFLLYFPAIIQFDTATASSHCRIGINGSTPTSTVCTASLGTNYLFNFTNPIPSSPLTANTNLTLVIANAATNPPSTAPASPFSLQTFAGDKTEVSSLNNSLSFSMTTPSVFLQNQFRRVSNTNAELTSYTLVLSQSAILQANSIIRVTFPSSTVLQSTSACSLTVLSVTSFVSCSRSGNTFRITSIGSPISGTFSLQFTNIRNPLSFEPLTGFTVTTKTSNDIFFYSSSSSTNSISNSVPTQFASLSYQYSPMQLDQPISLQLSFQLSQFTVVPSYLQLTIDPYFGVTSLTCAAFIDFAGSCTTLSNSTIRVSGSFNSSIMGFTVQGFRAPTSSPSTTTYTVVNSFAAGGFKIDQSSTNISFSLQCDLPCKTCSSSNRSSCLSCYSNTLVTSAIFFHSASSFCYINCPATTYNDNLTSLCTICNSNCLQCRGSANFCTRCRPNSTFPFLNITNTTQVCVSSCVSRMYPDTTIDPATCVNCKSPCATCTSETTCLTCLSGFYFFNGSCGTDCPADTSIRNNITQQCDPCDPICLRCSGTTTTCTACRTPLVFFNGSCQTSCPAGGRLAPLDGVCTPCNAVCQTCSGTVSNCTSCSLTSSNIFLMNNTCLAQCPIYYYNQSSTGSCLLCSNAGINCVNCSSASTCYTCDNSFVFFNNRCLSEVPFGYVNISGQAVKCTGDCETCSITPGNCTDCLTLNLQGYSCVAICSAGRVPFNQVCLPCTWPCLTCSVTQSNCTSCVSNSSSPLFLHLNTCQSTCPTFFFANTGNNQCTACSDPCVTCTSSTDCLSCSSSTFLFNTSCLPTCPPGNAGVNRRCLACTDNCKTCSGATNICTSCVNGTYFLNSTSSCLTSCGSGLFIDFVNQRCVGCQAPCQTCSNSSTTCTSCLTGILFNFNCLPTCPPSTFNQAGSCVNCPSVCSSCSSLSNCSVCSGATYLFNNYCLDTCPNTAPVIINKICTACSTVNCFTCTSGDVCTMCQATFLYFNAFCIPVCPTGFNSNGTHCNSIVQAALVQTGTAFPVPFSIAGVVLIIACLMSRLQFSQTYLSGAVFSFIAVLQCGALWVFAYLYYFSPYMNEPIALFIGLGALAFLYLMNIIAMIAQSVFLSYQKQFVSWKESSRFNGCFNGFVGVISLLISHKFRNILFCKLFTFKIVSAKLDQVDHFRIFNIFSLISLVGSGTAIFAASVALTKSNKSQQLYMLCIDVIVLHSINIIMAFFNTHKDKQFFNQYTTDGLILHKKHNINEQYLMGQKISVQGMDAEQEEGYYNNVNHAIESRNALQFSSGSQINSYSQSNIMERYEQQKQYEQVSVQAVDLLDPKGTLSTKGPRPNQKPTYKEIQIQADQLLTQNKNGINESSLPIQNANDTSNFTTLFPKVDQSVQGRLDRGKSFAAQFQVNHADISIQKELSFSKVDISIQKYSDKKRADISIQPTLEPSRADISIQKTNQNVDESVQVSYRQNSIGFQQAAQITQKSISAHPSVQDKANQLIIQQNDYAIQSQLQNRQIAIQYQNDNVFYNQFEQDLGQETPSNVLYEQADQKQQSQFDQRNLIEQKVDQLEVKPDNIRSYQEQLQDRIRDRQKELQEMRRKIDIKELGNARKKQQINNFNQITIQKVDLRGIKYVEQRPVVNVPVGQKSSPNINKKLKSPDKNNGDSQSISGVSRNSQQLSNRSGLGGFSSRQKKPDISQLHIQSKQMPQSQRRSEVEQDAIEPNQTLEEIQVVDQTQSKTIQQIDVQQSKPQMSQNDKRNDRRQKAKVEYQQVNNQLASQSESSYKAQTVQNAQGIIKQSAPNVVGSPQKSQKNKNNQQKRKIQYKQMNKQLLSDQQERNQVPTKQNQQKLASKGVNLSPQKLQKSKDSQITKKSKVYASRAGANIEEVDRQFIDQPDQLIQFEQSEPEPAGIQSSYFNTKGRYIGQQASELSGTIQEIPRHYIRNDNDKTITNFDSKKRNGNAQANKNQQNNRDYEPQPTKLDPKNITNYFSDNIANSIPTRQRPKDLPVQTDTAQRFVINRLYSRNDIAKKQQDSMPSKHQKKNSTFALAGRSQFTQEVVQKKESNPNPLYAKRKQQWQVENEDKYISDDDQPYRPVNNRQNITKKSKSKGKDNFSSHLVLPQQSDKQGMSFNNKKEDKIDKKQSYSTKGKERRPVHTRQLEEVQVHFQADQFNRQLSVKQKNQSPSRPGVGQKNFAYSRDSELYEDDDSQGVNYQNMMLMNQMQQRPNQDLQEYYQKKRSKEKRQVSNSKINRSTQKIYMQRLK